MNVYTAMCRRAHGPCTRLCTGYAVGRVHGAHTANGIHGRCTRVHVYTAVIRPCTGRVHGPSTSRYRSCTWYVHGRVNAVSTAHVHVYKCRRHGRERAVYEPCTRPVYAAVQRPYSAVYMARTWPCTRHVHVYTCTCTRTCVYTAVTWP